MRCSKRARVLQSQKHGGKQRMLSPSSVLIGGGTKHKEAVSTNARDFQGFLVSIPDLVFGFLPSSPGYFRTQPSRTWPTTLIMVSLFSRSTRSCLNSGCACSKCKARQTRGGGCFVRTIRAAGTAGWRLESPKRVPFQDRNTILVFVESRATCTVVEQHSQQP